MSDDFEDDRGFLKKGSDNLEWDTGFDYGDFAGMAQRNQSLAKQKAILQEQKEIKSLLAQQEARKQAEERRLASLPKCPACKSPVEVGSTRCKHCHEKIASWDYSGESLQWRLICLAGDLEASLIERLDDLKLMANELLAQSKETVELFGKNVSENLNNLSDVKQSLSNLPDEKYDELEAVFLCHIAQKKMRGLQNEEIHADALKKRNHAKDTYSKAKNKLGQDKEKLQKICDWMTTTASLCSSVIVSLIVTVIATTAIPEKIGGVTYFPDDKLSAGGLLIGFLSFPVCCFLFWSEANLSFITTTPLVALIQSGKDEYESLKPLVEEQEDKLVLLRNAAGDSKQKVNNLISKEENHWKKIFTQMNILEKSSDIAQHINHTRGKFANSFKEYREQFEKIKEAEIDLNLCKQEMGCELYTTIWPEIFGDFISDASTLMDLKPPTNFQDVEKLLESEKYLVDEASSWL